MTARVLAGDGEIERSAFCIHAPIHRLPRKRCCVLHTHMPYASALTRLEEPQIQTIGQTEIDSYRSPTTRNIPALPSTRAEGERLAGVLGDKSILFMANHGVLVCGETVARAYDRLYYLERACQVQLYAMWTGQRLKKVSQAVDRQDHRPVRRRPGRSATSRRPAEHHFAALKRLLDRKRAGLRRVIGGGAGLWLRRQGDGAVRRARTCRPTSTS